MRWKYHVAMFAACAWTFHAAAAQQPQPSPPVFRSTVDLLTVEASVRDDSGTPVRDLTSADFTVTVDGKPRTILFAHFFHSDAAPIVVESGLPVGHYESNESAPAGQVVVFAVDRDALAPGTERPILDSASRMLNSLSPGDAVGLVNIPGAIIDVTRDHARVADALKAITGTRPPRMSARTVTWEEASASARGDKRALDAAFDRECKATGHGDDPFCAAELKQAFRETLTNTRSHAQTLLPALSSVIRQLGRLQAPKHLVFLSSGLPSDQEFVDLFRDVERAAAEARVTVHTVRLHDFEGDASSDTKSHGPLESPALAAGMDSIATMTGGLAFMGVAKAIGVFDRIGSEVTIFYQLGVESSPADANGKLHDIKVSVRRPHVSARATPAAVIPRKEDGHDALTAALQQPVDTPAVPIAVSTYAMPAAKNVRVLVAAEIGASGGAAPAEWAAVVLEGGKAIATARGRIAPAPERPRLVTTSMELPEGKYRLRVAATDADGRAGTVEIPIAVALRTSAQGALAGDLVLGAAKDKQLEPRRRVSADEELTALVQVAGVSDENISGTLRLIPAGKAQSLPPVPMELRRGASADGPTGLQATLVAGAIPAGRYTAVATIVSGTEMVAQVGRVIEISPAVATATPNAAPAPAPALIPTISMTADALMHRVASYVEGYGEQASVIIILEHYTQRSTSAGVGGAAVRMGRGGYPSSTASLMDERKLVSELALVRNTAAIGGWLAFRDVVEANGKAVQDRRDRLAALFEQHTLDLVEAQRITTESARYNIGAIKRTFNVPTATLFFFHPANLSRFKFRDRGHERIDGIDTAVIEFQETGKPTLIMNSNHHDVPSSGVLWIDPSDGTVVKTELTLSGYAGPRSYVLVQVTFHRDSNVEMWIPSVMQESYGVGSSSLDGRAIYTDAKRFRTGARIK